MSATQSVTPPSTELLPSTDADKIVQEESDPLLLSAPSECLICSNAMESRRSGHSADCLTLLVNYPDILLLNSSPVKTEANHLRLQLKELVICDTCATEMQQVSLIMTQLEHLHQQMTQLQKQVSRQMRACSGWSSIRPSNLLSRVRRQVLHELESRMVVAADPGNCRPHTTTNADQLTSQCVVKLMRLEPVHRSTPEESVEVIKQEQEVEQAEGWQNAFLELDMDPSLLSSPPRPSPASSEEFILPTTRRRVMRAGMRKLKRGRPRKTSTRQVSDRDWSEEIVQEEHAGNPRKSRQGHNTCEFRGCRFRSMRASQLIKHVAYVHSKCRDRAFMCTKCGSCFPSQMEELQKHKESHTKNSSGRRFTCPHCSASFTSCSNVRSHCRRKHPSKTQPTRADFPDPGRRQRPESRLTCCYCTSSFTQFKNLKYHCSRAHSEQPVPNKTDFPGLQQREVHERRFHCKHCPLVSTALNNHRVHYRNRHPDQPLPTRQDFPILPRKPRIPKPKQSPLPTSTAGPSADAEVRTCPYCKEVFTGITKWNFKAHLAQHTKPHQCQVEGCTARFSSAMALRCHCVRFHPELQVHPGYSCPHCTFTTNRPESIRAHVKAKHETHLTTPCSVPGCAFRTPNASRLKQHMERVHEGRKNFLCTECGRGYYFRAKLLIHMRTHTGDKPFACNFCGKRFTRKDKMQHHVLTHGSSRPHVCELCGMGFPTRNNLIGHRHSWHKNRLFRVGVRPTRKSKYDVEEVEGSGEGREHSEQGDKSLLLLQ